MAKRVMENWLRTVTCGALDLLAEMRAADWERPDVFRSAALRTYAADIDEVVNQPVRKPRRRRAGKRPAYRKNMRAADILKAHFEAHPADVYAPARELAKRLGVGSTTVNEYQVRIRGRLEERQ